MADKYYAHSTSSGDVNEWQPLAEHLFNVANRSRGFANIFGAGIWAELIGRHHDLGKGTRQWQAWLRNVNNVVDEFYHDLEGHPSHAFQGAQQLARQSSQAGKLLAYCVAGHHAGLPDWAGKPAGLKNRLEQQYPELSIPLSAKSCFPKLLPFPIDSSRMGFQFQFFIRMLFSCLIDADFLDTEQALNPEKAKWRDNNTDIASLSVKFRENFNKLRKQADSASTVNQQREKVLNDCLAAARQKPGLFSLTVPTGGGKTLASLAFALEHANIHKLQRIIYVIPFTTIIEQNAEVFREMLGDDTVLEHHSNFIPDDEDWKARLSSENWDSPVIVTTNVQFFNSFYASKPSKCRKLHNVARSIIIFDEVQAIPVGKLKPCLEVIRELSLSYGVTSILCTATQPTLEKSASFAEGLDNVKAIITDIPTLFSKLKRTEETYIGTLSDEELAKKLMALDQVLSIVNTRQQALDIFSCLPATSKEPEQPENYHLSALMYPVHRSIILKQIRAKLSNGQRCRVISTQLIEAGVDIDFPIVFRAIAGIDSIAQAAGRCNRNGKNKKPGRVFIFTPEQETDSSFIRHAAQSAGKLFAKYNNNLTDPNCVHQYFTDYLWKNEQRMDEDGILELCRRAANLEVQFREISEFKMIESPTIPVIIALEQECIDLVNQLEFVEHSGGILRKLQRYSVQIYPYQLDEIKDWLESPVPGIFVLRSGELYSKITGLQCSPPEGQAFFG